MRGSRRFSTPKKMGGPDDLGSEVNLSGAVSFFLFFIGLGIFSCIAIFAVLYLTTNFSSVNSDVITGAATIGALAIAGWQLRQNAKMAGQTHARDAWLRYLEIGIQYPQYSTTKLAMKLLKVNDVNRIFALESLESERYLWFKDLTLETCESLLNYFPADEWKNTVAYNVSLHIEAIEASWNEERKFYSEPMVALIEDQIKARSSLASQSLDIPMS